MKNGFLKLRLTALWFNTLGLLLLFPVAASAHTVTGGASGFATGFAHPLGGVDHLLAMLAVGLWAAQLGGRALWLVPTAFVGMMLAGGALGMLHIGVPFVEQGILASLVVLGVLIASAFRLPATAGALLVAVFALFHGHAHGSEMPLSANGLSFAAGFMLATTLLHGTGIALGLALKRFDAARMARVAGGAIALSGLYLTLV
jgi:urease accessory protein